MSGARRKRVSCSAARQSKKQPEVSEQEAKSSDYKSNDSTEKAEISPVNEPLRSEKAAAKSRAPIEEETSALDEVVVTGYGVSKAESEK